MPPSTSQDEPSRLRALQDYAVLDTPSDAALDRVTHLARSLFDVPMAAITFVDAERDWFKSRVGFAMPEIAREVGFCSHVLSSNKVLILQDVAQDPRFANCPLVTGEPGVKFYAGAPLYTPEGFCLGALAVFARETRDFAAKQSQLLTDMAEVVMDELELQRVAALQLREGAEQEPGRPTARGWSLLESSSHRKAADLARLLESVVVNTDNGVIITEAFPISNPGPRIVYVNEAHLKICGYTREELLGRSPRLFQGAKTDRAAVRVIRQTLLRQEAHQVELLNYRKDGSEFWVEMNIVPVWGEDGKQTHWISIQRETTQRRKQEAELRAAKESADRANRAKSEFLSRMSHELRTPLNAILGFVQLFDRSAMSLEDRQGAEHILVAGRHLLRLVDEVLDLSRVEIGELRLEPVPVELAEAIDFVVALVRPLAARRRLRVEVLPPAEPLAVLADRQRLQQILINLVSNAIKYNREGGVLKIRWRAVRKGVCVEVCDEGAGILGEDIVKLFHPFERLGAAERGVDGTGIGLVLSKLLAEAMHGRLELRESSEAGSTFALELPLAHLPPKERGRVPAGPEDSRAEAASVPHQKVLYVEDNPVNVTLVRRILARRGGTMLLAAANGREGLEIAARERPALILLDLHLPDMEGDEVLTRLKRGAATKEIPVIMVSADAMGSVIAHLLALGADTYITKPFDVNAFQKTVDRFLIERAGAEEA